MDWTETAGFGDGLPNGGVDLNEQQPDDDAERLNDDWAVGRNEPPGAGRLPWPADRQQ